MKKHLFTILASFFLLVVLLPTQVSAVRYPREHSVEHCLCGSHVGSTGHSSYEIVNFRRPGATGSTRDSQAIISETAEYLGNYQYSKLSQINSTVTKQVHNFVLDSDITIEGRDNDWTVPSGDPVVLCLNGYNITCKDTNTSTAIYVPSGATLILVDCSILGDRGSVIGDGTVPIWVAAGGTLKLYGVGFTAPEKNAIINWGTVEMYDGGQYWTSTEYPNSHAVNTNIRDSSVGIFSVGTVKMYGGEITGNNTGISAMHSTGTSTVDVVNGKISGNKLGINASNSTISVGSGESTVTLQNNTGGAIYATDNTKLTIGNATITGNGSYDDQYRGLGAVLMANDSSTLTLTGSANITGNTGANLFLYATTKIKLGTLASDARIGITTDEDDFPPYAFSEVCDTNYANRFTADNDKLGIAYNASKQLELRKKYSITVQSGVGGTASASTDGAVEGAQVTLSARPNDHYSFQKWEIVSGKGTISGNTLTMAASNITVKAVFQPETYTITYAPGADGTGSTQTDSKSYDIPLILKGALFTRNGYTQVGWSTYDGGELAYSLEAVYEGNAAITLYPVWEERSDYTVHIVNRDGSKVMDYENVKWTDNIWDLLTPRPTRGDDKLIGLWCGQKRVSNGTSYGYFAVNGEDSLTMVAVWSFTVDGTISIGDSQWSGYASDRDEYFFREDQTVTIATDHPEEMLNFTYMVSDQMYPTESDADHAWKSSLETAYTGPFSTSSLKLEEGKPYVIYCYLMNEAKSWHIINSGKIIIDKTAPVINGVKDGDVFCDAESKTITVTDLYLDTVTVNGTAVTPNDKGEITLSAGADPQTVIATDKAGNSTKLTVTVHASHSYQWKTENGQYWGECESCGSKTERKAIPELTITSPDTVCRSQDFTFSFRLPEGCTNPSYSYEFTYTGDGEPVTAADGVCTGSIPAASYQEGESSFRFIASVSTAEGYRVSVDKTITIQAQHAGGTATCTEQAVCDTCKQPYGDLLPHDFTAETADAKYLKTDATCTDSAVYYKSCTACGISAKDLDEDAVFTSGEPLGHDFGKWTSNQDGTHSRVCSHDAAHTETAPCSGGTATCLESAICEVCGTGYGEIDPEHHTGTAQWITTEETHKQAYTCCGAVVVAEGPHVYDDEKDATCNDCGFNREIPHDHTYDGWSMDAENHWRACTDPDCPDPTGSILDKAAHVYDNDKDAVCNICGYERTIPHEHTYGAWSTDAMNHWHVCTDPDCPDSTGSIQDKAAHTYTNDQDATCNICGYQRTIVTPVVNPFKDVKESDWCYDDIMYVYEQGLMVGTKSDTFSPNLSLTRGMMATIIWRMEGSPAPTAAASFRDVPSGMWCADAIAWTAEHSIFLGYGDHSFKPNEKITRQQLVTILYRYTDYLGKDVTASGDLSGFKDTDQLASWAETPMRWAVGTGLIRGKTATTLDPRSSATRAQVAAILHRFLS